MLINIRLKIFTELRTKLVLFRYIYYKLQIVSLYKLSQNETMSIKFIAVRVNIYILVYALYYACIIKNV